MGTLVDSLGRVSGNLIRAEDWNALLSAVEALDTRLSGQITTLSNSVDTRFAAVNTSITNLTAAVSTLSSQVSALNTKVDTLKMSFDSFRTNTEGLIAQFYRVTLHTDYLYYAVGEVAEITAQVTDLRGNPLSLTASNRPWIDFVATWGKFRVASGFESRSAANERSMAVRVNTQGVAKVRLHAECVEGLAWDTEDAMSNFMHSSVEGTGKNVAKHMLDSASPSQAKAAGAFKMATVAYESAAGSGMSAYADAYFSKAKVAGKHRGAGAIAQDAWKDYQTTVLAFAKGDADPRTPDQARGASSMQVTFRDWLIAWIDNDYLDDVLVVADDYRKRFDAKFKDDFKESLDAVSEEVDEILHGKGILGRKRHAKAIQDALDKVDPPRGAYKDDVVMAVKDAMTVQESVDMPEAVHAGAAKEAGVFRAMARAGTNAHARVVKLTEQVAKMEQGVQGVTEQMSGVRRDFASLDGRMTASFSEGGVVQLLNSRMESVSRQVQVIQGLNVSEVQNKLVMLEGIGNRLASLETAFHSR